VTLSAACGFHNGTSAKAERSAETTLQNAVLDVNDVGAGYVLSSSSFRSNDALAAARPDAAAARAQYADWRQALTYNVQYESTNATSFSSSFARVMNTATLFGAGDGASSWLASVNALPDEAVRDFLINEGEGTRIEDTQVTKDIPFAAKGDESFAWRLSGKATFDTGATQTFVADAVYVRAGRIAGNVVVVSFGAAPDRAALEALVDRFVARMRGADA
jgi:hypothetical protein